MAIHEYYVGRTKGGNLLFKILSIFGQELRVVPFLTLAVYSITDYPSCLDRKFGCNCS